MALRKYQVEGIAEQVQDRLRREKEAAKEDDSFTEALQSKKEAIETSISLPTIGQLFEKEKMLQQQVKDARKERHKLIRAANDRLDSSNQIYEHTATLDKMWEAVNKQAEIEALDEAGVLQASTRKIKNIVITSDIEGGDNLVERVMNKLQQQRS